MDTINLTFKALSVLLGYPDAAATAAIPEIRVALAAEPRLPRRVRDDLGALCDELAAGKALEAEERYVALFDRGRATSLNLFEHVHGDSRDRGQAMVDLAGLYERGGLALEARELPDYLPALLEFLSLQPAAVAVEMLSETAHILRKLGDALAARGSRYAAIPAALLAWAGEEGLSAHPAPVEEKPLDAEWIEEPVVFGPAAAPACGAPAPSASVVTFVPRAHPVPGASR